MQIAGSPACLSPSYSHAVREQASKPMRSSGSPCSLQSRYQRVRLAGRSKLFMMRAVSSTTQIAVSSSDTSNPAKYLMAAPSRCLWRSDNRPRLSSRWSSHCSVLRQDPNHITPPSDSKVRAPNIISNDRFRNGQRPLSPRLRNWSSCPYSDIASADRSVSTVSKAAVRSCV